MRACVRSCESAAVRRCLRRSLAAHHPSALPHTVCTPAHAWAGARRELGPPTFPTTSNTPARSPEAAPRCCRCTTLPSMAHAIHPCGQQHHHRTTEPRLSTEPQYSERRGSQEAGCSARRPTASRPPAVNPHTHWLAHVARRCAVHVLATPIQQSDHLYPQEPLGQLPLPPLCHLPCPAHTRTRARSPPTPTLTHSPSPLHAPRAPVGPVLPHRRGPHAPTTRCAGACALLSPRALATIGLRGDPSAKSWLCLPLPLRSLARKLPWPRATVCAQAAPHHGVALPLIMGAKLGGGRSPGAWSSTPRVLPAMRACSACVSSSCCKQWADPPSHLKHPPLCAHAPSTLLAPQTASGAWCAASSTTTSPAASRPSTT